MASKRPTKPEPSSASPVLEGLNEEQRQAVLHGEGPLLIVAGAGTGKTRTLVHRVARAIETGVDPRRILLLTFTRRAAAEMMRRVHALLRTLGRREDTPQHGTDTGAGDADAAPPGRTVAVAASAAAAAAGSIAWGGTFHAIAARLLRIHGQAIGLEPDFSIHDRGDSEDLIDTLRTELDLAKATAKRFPRKSTCVAIYSYSLNAQEPLEDTLARQFPWCSEHQDALKSLFRAYVDRKEAMHVLDYDDLLLFWSEILADPSEGTRIRERFDRVFVDEYQDTNRLQAEVLKRLRPDGSGLTVVGDDAQSIYSFRAATVRNILDFPREFPGTTVLKIEQNFRSTTPILAATNAVIAASPERYKKDLWSAREGGDRPLLVTCSDENEQAEHVASRVLERRESGIDLRRQAVLFRAAHHSIVLEAELARRGIPFVKYGGLKFIEAAHVKDLMAFLRFAENPRDEVSGARLLLLVPGIGPRKAHDLLAALRSGGGSVTAWRKAVVPPAGRKLWPRLVRLLEGLAGASALEMSVAAQVGRVRKFYAPIAEEHYDNADARLRDLEQLEQIAGRYGDRRSMLADITLDPPSSTEDLAGPPHLDDDFLVLSTIHSAKGLEWDAVTVIHASDGNIPSDLSTGSVTQIEEERRLLYVALTRARRHLEICFPLRYYVASRGAWADDHVYGQLSRFVTPRVKKLFDACLATVSGETREEGSPTDRSSATEAARARIRDCLRSRWS